MRGAFMILMLGALLLVAYLVIKDVSSRSEGKKSAITVIDRAASGRAKAEEANRAMEKRLDNAAGE